MKIRLLILVFTITKIAMAQTYKEVKGGLLPERACFDVGYYDLHLTINPDEKTIKGHNVITFKVVKATKKIQIDLFKNLDIDSVVFENKKLSYERKFDAFFVDFPFELELNKNYSVAVYYGGKPRTNIGVRSTDGFHWKTYNKLPLVGIACQIVGASVWYPCKEYLGDEPDSVRLHWTVPVQLQCISNGKLEKVENSPISGYKTSHWVVRNPINSYNITVYLGDYQKVSGAYINSSGRHSMEYYFLKKTDKSSKDAEKEKFYVQMGLSFVAFCEKTFGEYAFWNDKLAVVETVYDGMEHQSCVAVGSLRENPMGYVYANDVNLHGTLIHELAHEWWGNAVSSSDMGDMWLHEGFATYTEYLFIEQMYGKQTYEAEISKMYENAVSGLGGNVYKTQTDKVLAPRNVYSNYVFGMQGQIYWAGAHFLHALRKEINNDTVFFDILRTFYERYKKKTVLTENFLQIVNEKTNKDWTQYFKNGLE
ncbi:MAG: M1 family metallopeptidase [Raineya sp.]|nr:M1 family metallopeptidase [Raineya sp.]